MPPLPDPIRDAMRRHLGYTEEEFAMFEADPRNARVMATAPDMLRKTIVFEVVASEGCNSRHTVGTRFFFTGDGNLITKMAPPRICAYALPIMTQAIFGIQEIWYAGADPDSLCFKRAGCFDVGVRCGGWGHVVVEARVMDREAAVELWRSGSPAHGS